MFGVITEMDLRFPIYITNAGGWRNQEPMLREKGFPDYQWIQTVSGSGQVDVGGKLHTVNPGQGMFLLPNERHGYAPVRQPWTVKWVTFNGAHMAELLASMHLDASTVLYVTHPDATLNKINTIVSLLQSADPLRGAECSAIGYQLLLDLFLYASRSEVRTKKQHAEQLAPAFLYIEEHYHEPISLQQLAERLRVTPQHTCLLFQQALGLRPIAYLTRYRLRKAKELLLQRPELGVREVAGRVGYEDSSYFIKLFKQQEGVTPNHFRKIHRLL
ncbi:HTH-type transcriptional activator Btr [Paenibacillus konkukensis]|uniref:HTH-type transcriptional activator Btr n=1 Tax=Paenibacillus konkukensis TaxID=2020716 RepID=A0ABY4RQR4_9BACL|nr:HTH-type transcriptional activator Btr [Paenibacillus konkukensis]